MTTLVGIRKRVAKGATFLDERVPGWAARIDLDLLRMSSPTMCILGQTDSGYIEHGVALGIITEGEDDTEAIALGFNIAEVDPPDRSRADPSNSEQWHELDQAWRAEIAKRLKGARA